MGPGTEFACARHAQIGLGMSEIKVYQSDDLRIEMHSMPDQLNLIWSGKSEEIDPDAFVQPILDEFLNRARMSRRGMKMDFQQMDYINSLTLKPIIKLLYNIKNHADSLSIVYNGRERWQEVNFRAMQALDSGDGRISVQPGV